MGVFFLRKVATLVVAYTSRKQFSSKVKNKLKSSHLNIKREEY